MENLETYTIKEWISELELVSQAIADINSLDLSIKVLQLDRSNDRRHDTALRLLLQEKKKQLENLHTLPGWKIIEGCWQSLNDFFDSLVVNLRKLVESELLGHTEEGRDVHV